MKLTQKQLSEYLNVTRLIKKLEQKKEEIRQSILEKNETEFKLGKFLVTVKDFMRVIPMHKQYGQRIKIKKVD